MDLDQQIQALIREAPADGITPGIIAAIAPVLKTLAAQRQHTQYFLLQSLQGQWAFSTLRHQHQGTQTVIYAFPTLKDATQFPTAKEDPSLIAVPKGIIALLFQTVILPVDTLLFFETPGNLQTSVPISTQQIKSLIHSRLTPPSSHLA